MYTFLVHNIYGTRTLFCHNVDLKPGASVTDERTENWTANISSACIEILLIFFFPAYSIRWHGLKPKKYYT